MIVQRAARPAGSPRRARGVALAAALAVATTVALTACAPAPGAAPGPDRAPAASAAPPTEAPAAPVPAAAPVTAPSPSPAVPLPVGLAPVSVAIPAMDLSESLIDLGLEPDGTMEVPTDFDDVGWFTGGGRPGGIGPTVIAGHVDSRSAPAVFFRLAELEVGDAVSVADSAGEVHDYEVYRIQSYPKADFPTADVFGALPTDELRLITCGGLFDESIGHYDDNLVVYAAP